jgi:hypothetical protein
VMGSAKGKRARSPLPLAILPDHLMVAYHCSGQEHNERIFIVSYLKVLLQN